jgi:hypothetical protein
MLIMYMVLRQADVKRVEKFWCNLLFPKQDFTKPKTTYETIVVKVHPEDPKWMKYICPYLVLRENQTLSMVHALALSKKLLFTSCCT